MSFQQERLNALLRRLTGGRYLALRLGLAYPLARRSRTAMTVAMYALVIFILVFITTLASMIDAQVATATARVQGGYALVVSSSPANPIPLRAIEGLDGVRSVAPLATTVADFKAGSMTKALPWNLTAFDKRFLEGGPPKLEDRGSYPTDLAAWQAVLNDDSLTIIDPAFLQASGGPAKFVAKPGSKLQVTDPYSGKTRTLTVAALSPSDYLIQNGAFYSAEGARTLFGWRLVSSRYYVALRRGVNADRFAQDVQSTFVRNGTEATSIHSLMDEGFTMTRQIFQLFQGYLGMGLIVGIAGIAVVMIRAGPRAPPPDRLTTGDRLRLAHDRAQLRHRVEPRGHRGNLDRHRARTRDALQHRHPQRCLREDHVRRPRSSPWLSCCSERSSPRSWPRSGRRSRQAALVLPSRCESPTNPVGFRSPVARLA